jgi:3-dehydroquinate dehydratase/shikimate dehydrogenase
MKIAVPVTATRHKEAGKDLEEVVKAKADIVELRIDYFENPSPNLEVLITKCKNSRIPVIITNRAKDEGGYFSGTEGERTGLLRESVCYCPEYVDIEFNHMVIMPKYLSKIIVSYHNFNETPQDLKGIYNKIIDTNADIVKIAVKANYEEDVARMISLIEYADKPIIGISMGELGKKTRLHPKNYLTFACLPGKASAPGQFEIDEIRKIIQS